MSIRVDGQGYRHSCVSGASYRPFICPFITVGSASHAGIRSGSFRADLFNHNTPGRHSRRYRQPAAIEADILPDDPSQCTDRSVCIRQRFNPTGSDHTLETKSPIARSHAAGRKFNTAFHLKTDAGIGLKVIDLLSRIGRMKVEEGTVIPEANRYHIGFIVQRQA